MKTIRNGIHKIDTYLNAALDLFGGNDGMCRYKCSDGERLKVNTHLSLISALCEPFRMELFITQNGLLAFVHSENYKYIFTDEY